MSNRTAILVLVMFAVGFVGFAMPADAQAPATRPANRGLFDGLGQDDDIPEPMPPAIKPRPGGGKAPGGKTPGGKAPAERPPAGDAPAGPAKAPVAGRSIVFLIDVSESADAASAVQRASKKAITSLRAGYRFRMLATHKGAMTSNSADFAAMGEGASDPARAAALKFAATIAPAGKSEMARLLPTAINMRPNVLYLLVDRKSDLAKAAELLRTLNADRRTRVNVILFEDGPTDANKLAAVMAIARDQGGTYRRDDVKAVEQPEATAGSAAAATRSQPPVAANGQAVNLIPLIDLSRDVVDGAWTVKGTEVVCDEGTHARLRLPYIPPPQYDLTIEFTATEESDHNAACLLGVHQLSSYGFYLGSGKNAVAGFGNIQGRSPTDDPSAYRVENLIEKGRRYQATLKVRNDSITGWLDGKMISELPLNAAGLTLDRKWRIGSDSIGIGTTRKAIFHVVQIVGHDGKGQAMTRSQPRALRGLPPFNPAKNASLIDRDAVVMQTPADKLGISRNAENTPVMIQGKPCDQYLYAPAPSSLIYQIPEGAVFFRAVGMKPSGTSDANDGEFKYFVYVDGNEVFVSKSINESKGMVAIEAVIPKGARRIELRVDKMGPTDRDHAIWAYPEFLLAP